jgi:hypothetical protein
VIGLGRSAAVPGRRGSPENRVEGINALRHPAILAVPAPLDPAPLGPRPLHMEASRSCKLLTSLGLDAIQPIAGPSLEMSNGQDSDLSLGLHEDQSIRKAWQECASDL